jgi:hypothetical protein
LRFSPPVRLPEPAATIKAAMRGREAIVAL